MKKLITLILIVATAITCMALLPTAAEEAVFDETGMKTVYLSDNGDDLNPGTSNTTPVKTFAKATSLLGDKGGIIMIPDKFTYFNLQNETCPYRMPGTKGATYIIRGEKADGSSVFGGERYMIVATANLKFDNLTYTTGEKTYAIVAEFFAMEFTDTVKTVPYEMPDGTKKIPTIIAGASGIAGNASQSCRLTLNGGTFKEVYGGCEKHKMGGPVFLTLGGNVHVVGDVFCGGKNTGCEVSGDVTLKMTGGTVDGKIYVGGNAENQLNNIVTSLKVSITVSGGKIGGIVGNLKNSTDPEAIYIEELEIDLTAYQPSSAAGWKEANISEMPTYAKVWLYGEDKTATTEPETTTAEETTTPEVTTPEETTAAGGANETTAKDEESTAAGTDDKGGCGSTVGIGGVAMILAVCGIAGIASKKRKND